MSSSSNPRPIVYTAIFGGFDVLKSPRHPDAAADYICLTDDENLPVPSPWERRVVKCDRSPRLQARYCKILPWAYFPNAETTIWHGGNVILTKRPYDYLTFIATGSDIAALPHPKRRCACKEAEVNIHDRRARKSAIQRQMRVYENDGFPHDHGLHAAFLLVRRHTKAIRKLGKLWWKHVHTYTARDQLSFDYCLWKLGIPIADIPIHRGSHDAGPYHKRLKHKRRAR